MRHIYDSGRPLLNCDFKHLHREIGVIVSAFAGGHFDVSYQRVTLNTASFGKGVSADQVTAEVIEDTEHLISHLTRVMEELAEHRARLEEELKRLKVEGVKLPEVDHD